MNTHPDRTTDAPGFLIAVSIELGCPGLPGLPAGNLEGFALLRCFISHRLTEAGQLLMPLGGSGELNDGVMACHVRDLCPSVAIFKEVIGPVLLPFTRRAWHDFREAFWRPVFPDPDVACPAGLIDDARLSRVHGRARQRLKIPASTPE